MADSEEMNLGCLESILGHCFGCKRPFLAKKKLDCIEADGEKHYQYLTASGNKAYSKLVDLVYGLQNIGVIDDADEIIEQLDALVSEEC